MHGQSEVSRIRTGLLAVPRVRLEGAPGLFRLLGSGYGLRISAQSVPGPFTDRSQSCSPRMIRSLARP
jgi:hypothetical protein